MKILKKIAFWVVVVCTTIITSTLLVFGIAYGYAHYKKCVYEKTPIKTSIVVKKSTEFLGTTITTTPAVGSNVGVGTGVTAGKVYTRLDLENGDCITIPNDEDTFSVGDKVTYKAFIIIK